MHSGQGFGPTREDEKLHLVELCAGSHRLTDSALEFGLAAMAFDVTKWHFFMVLSSNLMLLIEMGNRHWML